MFLNAIRIFILISFILSPNIFAAKSQELLIPKNDLDTLLASYSSADKVLIEMDRKNIRELCFFQAKVGQKQLAYVATASGPGASRITVMDDYLLNRPGYVYVDPDQRGLRFMINTYLHSINNTAFHKSMSFHDLLSNSFVKWRDGSEYIVDTILNDAYAKKYAIAHGASSVSKSMDELYKKLHARGYKITLLLCDSSRENRIRAIQHMEINRCFILSTQEEFTKNEQMFYENYPVYFKYADEIQFYWVEDYVAGIIKVGEYSRDAGFKLLHRDFENFKGAYEDFRANQPSTTLPSFDELLAKKSSISNNGKKKPTP